ncbi:MAG: RNA-binding S4 domain-containing protein [Candidatus Omnitrophota bacterium]|nr:RNA-binding S4 domain-containing protein [Candidatus Omnitrophota bacterium]
MEFKLKTEFIELDNLLKLLELVINSAQAKQQIQAGAVKVNGLVESRIRRKLRSGDLVEFGANTITVVGQG